MAEKIIRGYLIEKKDFKVFDEIITFISSSGRKYTCMSMGSRKIESKNSRNLFLGSLIEFEIFEARSVDKVSKLKKAHVVVEND
jgi:DNA repair protein RecO (recombination protein O)